jgi:heat shock protein HslJ
MRTLLTAALLITLVFTGCDETKRVIDTAGSVQLSGTYNITMAGSQNIKGDDTKITFAALDKSVRGNAGCNEFFGNYTLDLYALNFGTLAATEMYCDEPVMKVERAIMGALRNTGSYTLENDILTLLSKNDRSVLLKASKIKNQN